MRAVSVREGDTRSSRVRSASSNRSRSSPVPASVNWWYWSSWEILLMWPNCSACFRSPSMAGCGQSMARRGLAGKQVNLDHRRLGVQDGQDIAERLDGRLRPNRDVNGRLRRRELAAAAEGSHGSLSHLVGAAATQTWFEERQQAGRAAAFGRYFGQPQ